ncbi:copper transporter [Moniliophthora roreri MCA 2997]|nr:copper transporter [Moniliophthora roreri MCA 2997]
MPFKWNTVLAFLFLLVPAVTVHSHENGMDMDMDSPMQLESGNMLMYFHFTPGDILWFEGWVPKSNGAMVGACIGLFLLAVVDRWLAGCRGMMEAHWRKRAQIAYTNKLNAAADLKKAEPSLKNMILMRTSSPFIPAHDIVRGIMQAGQAALGFALMLAVMTFQLAFLLSIVIGLGVGETLFGRFSVSAHIH